MHPYWRISLIVPIACISLLFFRWFENPMWMIPSVFISAFIVFHNFPYTTKWLNVKPIYLEDLHANEIIEPEIKEKFEKLFSYIIQLFMSIVIASLILYFMNKIHENPPILELLGMIGGLISLFVSVQNSIGSILLTCMTKKQRFIPLEIII